MTKHRNYIINQFESAEKYGNFHYVAKRAEKAGLGKRAKTYEELEELLN